MTIDVHPAVVPTPEASDSAGDWVAPFVGALFAALDDADINWLLPRNHQDIPHQVGHDVDILVHPDDSKKVEALLREVIQEQDLILLRSYVGLEHHTFDVAAADLRGRLVLHVDVQTALQYRGRMLVDAEDLLRSRRRAGTLWVPTPAMEAYVLLLHAAVHKRALKPKYARRIAHLREIDPEGFERVAGERVGPEMARRLAAVRTEPELLSLHHPLENAVDRRHPGNIFRRPSFSVRSAFRQFILRLRPRGVFVVFLGPDGSGKSSTTDLLARMLGGHEDVLPIHRVYLGSGEPLLPTRRLVRRLRGKSGPRAKAKPSVIRDVTPRRLRGALHVLADEIVRYWVQVRPLLSPHGVVLADRYAYDILRVNNPTVSKSWFRRFVIGVVPSPDITIYLDGDPAVVAARKRELTLEETIRQQEAYRALEGVVPGFMSLDLSRRDDASLRETALKILEAYAARNRGFLR